MPRLLGASNEPGFRVRLLTVGDQPIEVIKLIREMTGLELREAKEIIDNVPSDVPVGAMDGTTLRGFRARLSALGAQTEIQSGTEGTPPPPAELRRRSVLLIASMALPELDEFCRKAPVDTFEQMLPKLFDAVASRATKPDALRQVILELQRGVLG
jgi:hypothetical protein